MSNQLKTEFYKLKTSPVTYLGAILMFAGGFFFGYLKLGSYVSDTGEAFSDVVCDTSLLF